MKNVLVVEDNPVCGAVIRELLDQAYDGAISSNLTTDPADGLSRLASEKYDLLILDLNFESSDPTKTLKDFTPFMRQLPTVVVSGFLDDAMRELAESCGADVCIPKAELSLEFMRVATRAACLEHNTKKLAKVAFTKVPEGT